MITVDWLPNCLVKCFYQKQKNSKKFHHRNLYPNKKNLPSYSLPYLPTPPLGQDMTQGQFLSEV